MIFGFNTDVKVGAVVYHVQSEARQKDLLLETQVFVRGQCIGKCTSPFPEEPVLVDFTEDIVQESLKAQHRRIVAAAREGNIEQELGTVITAPGADKGEARSQVAGQTAPASEFPVLDASQSEIPAAVLDLGVWPAEVPVPLADGSAASKKKIEAVLTSAVPAGSESPTSGVVSQADAPVEHPTAQAPAPPQIGELLRASPEGLTTGSLKIECTHAQWVEEEQALLLVLQVHREEVPLNASALTLRVVGGQGHPRYAYSNTDANGVAAVSITLDDASGREAKVLVQAEGVGESATRRFRLQPLAQP